MSGIIITPGTFNPPATPGVSYGFPVWPKTPVMTLKRRPMQFASRSGGEPPAPESPYDDSAMTMPAAAVWPASLIVDGAYDVWSAFRRVAIVLTWRDLPSEVTTIRIAGVTEIAVAVGTADLDVGIEFKVADLSSEGTAIDNKALWTPYMDGQDFDSAGSGSYADVNYDPAGVEVHIVYPSAVYGSVQVEWISEASVIGSYQIFPAYSTTTELRTTALADTAEDSGRELRLEWKPAIGYYLRMPSGFTTYPAQTYP